MKKLLALLALPFIALTSPVAAEVQTSTASWYGPGFHGRTTANGERYNQYGISAAHKSLPFGTRVRICNQWSSKCVDVRINDRGPYIAGRSFDLSYGAAAQIGMLSSGVVPITYEIL